MCESKTLYDNKVSQNKELNKMHFCLTRVSPETCGLYLVIPSVCGSHFSSFAI